MSDGPLSPEEVAHRGFGTTFRGFDTGEVRAYLQRVANDLREATARERDLHRRLADAEYRAAHPVLEGDALTRSLGDEMGRVLATAQEAANGLKDKAEENAARILREAHDQAQRIRAQAEAILAVRTEEADAEAAGIRRAAQEEGAGVVERARREAAAAMADVEDKARQLVHDAQAARARVLGDLTRRRRLLQTQVEQLRAGRERLLEAYRKVRSTTDEVADELQRVENEAREAAGAAGERVAAGLVTGDDLDDVLAAFPAEPAAGGEGGAHVAAGPAPESTGTTASVAGAETAGSGEAPTAAPVAPIAANVKLEVAAQVASQAAESAEAEAQAAEAAAVEAQAAEAAAVEEGGGSGAGNATQIVSTRPGGSAERRPLRLLRRPKAEARSLDVMAVTAGDEAVRVIPPGPASVGKSGTVTAGRSETVPAGEAGDAGGTTTGAEAEPHEPTPADTAVSPQASEADVAAAAAVAGVDELFARIRAGRADAVARAHEVLAADSGASAQADDPPPGDQVEGGPAPEGPPGPVDEESLLRRRDTAVEGIEAKLARKLKRALQDEQNEVLDRLRSARTGADPEAVLLSPAEQAGRYKRAAEELLRASAAAGVGFVSPGEDARPEVPDIDDVVTDLAASLAEPLRRALERALGGDGADQAAVGDRVGAAYRECKAQRIEGLAGDAVTAAFGRGTLAALPAGAASRWVVDDDGRPCPDCDDNALAGPTAAGEAFPTGQRHPPAHAGCRCMLAPAELAAAVAGPA